MPKTQTKPKRDRRDAKIARLERIFAAAEKALGDRLKDVDLLTRKLGEMEIGRLAMQGEITALGETMTLLRRQGLHVRAVHDALAQRYIGAKLETQGFTVDQANQWLANERASLEAGLSRIAQEVSRELAGAEQNGASEAADG